MTMYEKLIFFLVKLKETGSLFTTFIIDIIHKKYCRGYTPKKE
jgi:hypothetical protein